MDEDFLKIDIKDVNKNPFKFFHSLNISSQLYPFFYDKDGELNLLITRRPEHFRIFGGEFVPPGGMADVFIEESGKEKLLPLEEALRSNVKIIDIEDPMLTAIREAKEETGLIVNPEDIRKVGYFINPMGVLVNIYIAEINLKNLEITEEVDSIHALPIKVLKNLEKVSVENRFLANPKFHTEEFINKKIAGVSDVMIIGTESVNYILGKKLEPDATYKFRSVYGLNMVLDRLSTLEKQPDKKITDHLMIEGCVILGSQLTKK